MLNVLAVLLILVIAIAKMVALVIALLVSSKLGDSHWDVNTGSPYDIRLPLAA